MEFKDKSTEKIYKYLKEQSKNKFDTPKNN